jgi:hypothetical protein
LNEVRIDRTSTSEHPVCEHSESRLVEISAEVREVADVVVEGEKRPRVVRRVLEQDDTS